MERFYPSRTIFIEEYIHVTKYIAQLASGFSLLVSLFVTPVLRRRLLRVGSFISRRDCRRPCEVTAQTRQFALSCPENNRIHTRMVSYEDALNGHVTDTSLATLSMKYLNPEKRSRWYKFSTADVCSSALRRKRFSR